MSKNKDNLQWWANLNDPNYCITVVDGLTDKMIPMVDALIPLREEGEIDVIDRYEIRKDDRYRLVYVYSEYSSMLTCVHDCLDLLGIEISISNSLRERCNPIENAKLFRQMGPPYFHNRSHVDFDMFYSTIQEVDCRQQRTLFKIGEIAKMKQFSDFLFETYENMSDDELCRRFREHDPTKSELLSIDGVSQKYCYTYGDYDDKFTTDYIVLDEPPEWFPTVVELEAFERRLQKRHADMGLQTVY